ncbi:hypothetical protein MNBD_GAMMA22-1156 [hydrothermal vent metagenome]|uniref:DUF2782 domain-containing protein n=1 Tax=hydrothermal vent metagenome TaxID=652676 RepID=A0A3B1B1G1_9ZZZZ
MNKQSRQLAFLTVFLMPQLALAEVAPPPAADFKKSKKSVPIKTPAVNHDKPNEQQEQFPVPELVIRYKDGAKIEEYRVNGQLRYSKITPASGPAYYLIDTNGDGIFDKRHDHLENPPIQQWLLYSW